MRLPRSFGVAILALVVGSGAFVTAQGQRGQPAPTATPAPATRTAFFAGQVIEHPSGRPVPQATVSLFGRGVPLGGRAGPPNPPVVADSQGRFFFSELAAGSYVLQVTKPGYAAATLGPLMRPIEVADAERIIDFKFRLTKLGSLAGTVRDDAGDPVVGTDVIAMLRTIVNGRPTLLPPERSRTDDRGMYRVANLRPGEYVLCACTRDPIPFDGVLLTTLAADPVQLLGVAVRALGAGADVASLDNTLRTFAPTFYPSSATVARATRITVAPGDEKAGLDISVEPIRATRVSGTIVGAPSPVMASSIRLVPAGESAEGASLVALTPMLVQPDGRFDFAGVPPGQYVLRVQHASNPAAGGVSGAALAFLGTRGGGAPVPQAGAGAFAPMGNPAEPPLWAAEPITVGDAGVSGLSIQLRRATKISGRVEFVGAAPQPAAQVLTRASVQAQPMSVEPSRPAVTGFGRLSPDATFLLDGVVPGRYVLSAFMPGWPTIKSVVVGGVDVTDIPIEIDTADVSDVVVTLGDTPMPTVLGTVTGGQRGSAEDVSVLFFPADRRYWADPAGAPRRFRSMPVARNGSFLTAALAPGEYFAIVVTDQQAIDWQQASRLDALSRTAQRVTLAEGDKKTLELKR